MCVCVCVSLLVPNYCCSPCAGASAFAPQSAGKSEAKPSGLGASTTSDITAMIGKTCATLVLRAHASARVFVCVRVLIVEYGVPRYHIFVHHVAIIQRSAWHRSVPVFVCMLVCLWARCTCVHTAAFLSCDWPNVRLCLRLRFWPHASDFKHVPVAVRLCHGHVRRVDHRVAQVRHGARAKLNAGRQAPPDMLTCVGCVAALTRC